MKYSIPNPLSSPPDVSRVADSTGSTTRPLPTVSARVLARLHPCERCLSSGPHHRVHHRLVCAYCNAPLRWLSSHKEV
jgi:hypothetical protein